MARAADLAVRGPMPLESRQVWEACAAGAVAATRRDLARRRDRHHFSADSKNRRLGDLRYIPVFETYASSVAAAAKAGTPDVYTYDELPPLLRRQISLIFSECIGRKSSTWYTTGQIMEREIKSYYQGRSFDGCMDYLRTSDDVVGVLTLVQICAQLMTEPLILEPSYQSAASEDPAKGLVELNQRFLQAGVGYQFEKNGRIIRISSQYVHAEVVKEALRLLSEPDFRDANDEFMKAHRHLREGSLRDCNTTALRSMETVLKVICDARGSTRRATPSSACSR